MEHRWGERVTVDFPVRITVHPFNVRRGRLQDLSLSGGFIETDTEFRVLTQLRVYIMSQHWAKQDGIEIPAYVIRKMKHGVGIEWCEFAPAQVSKLLRSSKHRPLTHTHKPMPGSVRRSGTR